MPVQASKVHANDVPRAYKKVTKVTQNKSFWGVTFYNVLMIWVYTFDSDMVMGIYS